MLANAPILFSRSGSLRADLHLPATFLSELLCFIANQLPSWRDDPDRKPATAEALLTSQLCAHLNAVSRHSDGWDVLQFRVEETDEVERGRKLDLVAAPCGPVLWVEGRRHVEFDTLLPIECKRLPTPRAKDRDEREYVFSRHGSVGGIHRFKAARHGASHALAGMIGYIQEGSATQWHASITAWIADLVAIEEQGWSGDDHLEMDREDESLRLAQLRSRHVRTGLPAIEILHLWVQMN